MAVSWSPDYNSARVPETDAFILSARDYGRLVATTKEVDAALARAHKAETEVERLRKMIHDHHFGVTEDGADGCCYCTIGTWLGREAEAYKSEQEGKS